MKIVAAVFCLLLAAPAAPPQTAAEVDRDLEEAKTLYRSARFSEAIRKLQAAVAQIQPQRDLEIRTLRLADAHLHLGLCYLALDDSEGAKDNFKQVVRLDGQRQLDPEVYAPKVRDLFEQARAEVEAEPARPVAPTAVRSAPPAVAKKEGRSPLPYVLIAGGAAAAAVAVAAGGSGKPAAAATPAPSPSPSTVPVRASVSLVAVEPQSGTTLAIGGCTVGPGGCPAAPRFKVTVTYDRDLPEGHVFVALFPASAPLCLSGASPVASLSAGAARQFDVSMSVFCQPPFTTNTANLQLRDSSQATLLQTTIPLTYHFVR